MAKSNSDDAAAKNNCDDCACTCDCKCCNKMCARMKKVHPLFATIVFILVIAIGFGTLAGVAKIQHNDISDLKSQVTSLQNDQKAESVRENGVSYQGVEGKTAMEILEAKHKVETKDYGDLGKMVISIDGVAATDGENFWAFYVDGQMAAEGASTYQTNDGETIEWKLEAVASY